MSDEPDIPMPQRYDPVLHYLTDYSCTAAMEAGPGGTMVGWEDYVLLRHAWERLKDE